jgi:hypothetical protein
MFNILDVPLGSSCLRSAIAGTARSEETDWIYVQIPAQTDGLYYCSWLMFFGTYEMGVLRVLVGRHAQGQGEADRQSARGLQPERRPQEDERKT